MERYNAYDTFAWFYNKYWGGRSLKRFMPVIDQLAISKILDHGKILDLCCGTGQMAKALADRGFNVTGLDGSDDMLHYARENAPEVEFVLADARDFSQDPVYDLVISAFDSLNHVMDIQDLQRVFQNVNRSLKPGAIFYFDMNMEQAFFTSWKTPWPLVENDHLIAVRPSYDPDTKIGKFEATMFTLENMMWTRKDVCLQQKCYSREEIMSALEISGFKDISVYSGETDFGWKAEGRDFFLGRKQK
jgi:SAM-dependent methyltransferase